MHLMDPEELDGLDDTGRDDVALGVVAGTHGDIRSGYPRPGGHTIVTLRDDLDFATAPVLRERLIDVLQRGIDLLILDLSHVPSCDAGGLAVLVATQRRAGLLGSTMRLVAPSLPVSKVLDATGLKRHFAICSELSGALAAERPKPAGLTSASAILPAAAGGGRVAAVRTVRLAGNGCGQTSPAPVGAHRSCGQSTAPRGAISRVATPRP
jgi:anti-anti-sigma factor